MALRKVYLGIDIGGTATKVVLLDDAGTPVNSMRTETVDLNSESECTRFASKLNRFVSECKVSSRNVRAVGLAIPGTVDELGISMLANVDLSLQHVLEALRDAFAVAELFYINDANAAAYAEMLQGASSGVSNSLYVTLGTGIGAGVILGGQLVEGAHGAAGEIGHIKVVKGGRRCNCGRRGCLEQYASARGIVRTFREVSANAPSVYEMLGASQSRPSDIAPRHESDSLAVFKAYEQGDHRAVHAVDLLAKTLGFSLAQVASVIDPEIIVLGGGVSLSAPLYFPQLIEAYRHQAIEPCKGIKLCQSKLGENAGCLGAALYAKDRS